MEENKNVKVEETVEVEVEVTNVPQEPTKKEKALNVAKKIGGGLWKTAKITAGAVGTVVIFALTVGTVIGAAKKGEEPILLVPKEPIKSDSDNEELNTEITSNEPTSDIGFDV